MGAVVNAKQAVGGSLSASEQVGHPYRHAQYVTSSGGWQV